MSFQMTLKKQLSSLYSPEEAEKAERAINNLLESYQQERPLNKENTFELSQKTTVLIAYGDSIHAQGQSPLAALKAFVKNYTDDKINAVHLLPFFPYSSDDGFSVIDYLKVNPDCGTWDDIASLGEIVDLAFDGVINHISAKSEWFIKYIEGVGPYTQFFIEASPEEDLSAVTRPRALPLLTPVQTSRGQKHVWTTFSDDQIDLNYQSPELLVEVLRVVLEYFARSCKILRLDAIAFLWKKPGTSCIHLDETHTLIKIIRTVLDQYCPDGILLSETNVPHKENISYFGDRGDEAQMVYQFPLPPLTAHAMLRENTQYLQAWLRSLQTEMPEKGTFFNFLASHDGVGVRPATGLMPNEEIDFLVQATQERGGRVSFKTNSDGSESPYELNINYLDFVASHLGNDEMMAKRFLLSQLFLISMPGVPGIYYHSLVGSRNDYQGLEKTGRNRSINREKLKLEALESDLSDKSQLRSLVLEGILQALALRQSEKAFHPYSAFTVLPSQSSLLLLKRGEGDEAIYCIFNFAEKSVTLSAEEVKELPANGKNRLNGESCSTENLLLESSEVVWLK